MSSITSIQLVPLAHSNLLNPDPLVAAGQGACSGEAGGVPVACAICPYPDTAQTIEVRTFNCAFGDNNPPTMTFVTGADGKTKMNGKGNSVGSLNGKAIYIGQDVAVTDQSTNWEFVLIPKVITSGLIKSTGERTVNIKNVYLVKNKDGCLQVVNGDQQMVVTPCDQANVLQQMMALLPDGTEVFKTPVTPISSSVTPVTTTVGYSSTTTGTGPKQTIISSWAINNQVASWLSFSLLPLFTLIL
jgi:hypothetical protein